MTKTNILPLLQLNSFRQMAKQKLRRNNYEFKLELNNINNF